MHLDLFEDVPLWISRPDAPQLSDIELFLDGYGIEREDYRRSWRKDVKDGRYCRAFNADITDSVKVGGSK